MTRVTAPEADNACRDIRLKRASRGAKTMVRREYREDGFNKFVKAVFLAVVLGAGAVIWQMLEDNRALDHRITALETRCAATVTRGAH